MYFRIWVRIVATLPFLAAAPIWAQSNYATPYTFTTFAGSGGTSSFLDGTGTAASFLKPNAVAVDASGNIFVADSGNGLIRKITPAGVVTTLAGSAGVVGHTDGTGTAATFSRPLGIAVDSAGNIYVADTDNSTIRKITSAGVVTTLAGSPGVAGSADGAGSSATFNGPLGLVVDASGNIYVADAGNYVIRKISPAGAVTTWAGTAGVSGNVDGTGADARFTYPVGVTIDSSGNICVVDWPSIRKITPSAVVTTFLGGIAWGSEDGTDTAAELNWPNSIAADGFGNLYVSHGTNPYPNPSFGGFDASVIRIVTPDPFSLTLAGGNWGNVDGTGTAAKFYGAQGLCVDGSGIVYVADTGNNAIRKITTSAVVSTFAGGAGSPGNADDLGSVAKFYGPQGVAVDGSGNVYVADRGNANIRKLSPSGKVTTMLPGPVDPILPPYYFGVTVDTSGNLFVTDGYGVSKITPNGRATNFAGHTYTGSGDGNANSASFYNPLGIGVDSSENVYVADSGNHTIRKIADGIVSTLAGLTGTPGSADGDGSAARFNLPGGLAVDSSGNIYVTDMGNATVRKITPTGNVTTLAGLAGQVGNADGTGSAARFDNPQGLTVDSTGNVYVVDSGNYSIRKITPAGVVTTLAGLSGVTGFASGTGSTARFAQPVGIAVNSKGYLFVADFGYNSIVVGSIDSVPSINTQPDDKTVAETQAATFSVTTAGGYLTYQWRKNGVDLAGETGAVLTIPSVALADAGTYDVVCANYLGSVTSSGALLTVNPIPAISSLSPSLQVLNPGQSLNLSVTATGTDSLSYQWLHNNVPVSDATTSGLSIPSVVRTDGGWYQVLIADANGTRRSATMFVTVAPAVTQMVAWGNDNSFNSPLMNFPGANLSTVTMVAPGGGPLALKSDGTVVAWGSSNHGELNIPDGLSGVVAVDSSNNGFSIALKSDGTVVAWGDNADGVVDVPAGLTGVVAIAAGWRHALALKGDGTVVAWGANIFYYGQTDVPTGLTGVVAVSAGGFFSLALKSDGTVVGWGEKVYGESNIPNDLANIVQISAGGYHALALKSDGTVVAWGSNFSGETTVPLGLSGVTLVDAGGGSSLALKSDGSLVAWGDNSGGQNSVPAGLANVMAISAGVSLALRDGSEDAPPVISSQPGNQTVLEGQSAAFSVTATGPAPLSYQWRKGSVDIAGATSSTLTFSAPLPSDAGSYDVVISDYLGSTASAAAMLTVHPLPIVNTLGSNRQVLNPGQNLNLGVTATGTGSLTYQWAHNGRPIPGATSSNYSITNTLAHDSGWYRVSVTDSIGSRNSEVFFVTITPSLTRVVGWGDTTFNQTHIPVGLTHAVAVAAGRWHALALQEDGTVVAWGTNFDGETNVPSDLNGVVAIASGDRYCFALKSDGTVVAWGLYDSTGVTTIPAGLHDVVAIDAHADHALALKSDGTIVAWGNDSLGQSTVPAGLTDIVAVAAGTYHSLALKSDGTVVAWGSDYTGETDVPAGLTGVIAIAAGWEYSLALKNDGTVVSWGRGMGSNPAGAGLAGVTAIVVGDTSALALKSDGTVVGWNSDDGVTSATPVPADISHVTAIAAGSSTFFAITAATNPVKSDFNGDGKSDLILTNTTTGERAVWLMNGTAISAGASLGILPTAWTISGKGDFDGDSKSDIILTNTTTCERAVWLMNGTAISAGASLGILPMAWTISGVGDFNGDGKSDIVLTNTMTGERAIWLMNGTAISAGASLGILPTAWTISGVGDFDGDGKSDIILTNTMTGERAIWLMNGTAISAGASLGILPTAWTISGVGDFNGDDKSDIVLTNTTTGERAIWLMNGTAISAGASLGILPTAWTINGIGDFNGDGKSDIFLTNTATGERAVWLMNGTAISAGAVLTVLPVGWVIQ